MSSENAAIAAATEQAAVKIWGGFGGEVWAMCQLCNETNADAETLDVLVRWASGHDCRPVNRD